MSQPTGYEADFHSQSQPQSSSQPHNLQPPPIEPIRSPTSPQARDSFSASSIPDHNSDIYINSYYYGNVDMPELATGTSNGPLPAWTSGFANSPIHSPLLNSNDDRMMRRLSWNDVDDLGQPSPSTSYLPHESGPSSHQRNVSSADAGLVRGPLELSPQPDTQTFASSTHDRLHVEARHFRLQTYILHLRSTISVNPWRTGTVASQRQHTHQRSTIELSSPRIKTVIEILPFDIMNHPKISSSAQLHQTKSSRQSQGSNPAQTSMRRQVIIRRATSTKPGMASIASANQCGA